MLVSGHIDLLQIAARVGTCYFLRKPFDSEDIFKVLDAALKQHLAPTSA
jgi:hypothetical protein